MRALKRFLDAAEGLFEIVHVVREADAMNREVQCEGARDETDEGREMFRAVWGLGTPGIKHRAAPKSGGEAKEKGLVLRFGGLTILLGAHLSEGEPTGLAEGDTAVYSSRGAQVRCTDIVEIGTSTGGLLIRKDRFETWWDATPKANHALHKHGGMPGPGTTAVPDIGLGSVGTIESDEGHKVD